MSASFAGWEREKLQRRLQVPAASPAPDVDQLARLTAELTTPHTGTAVASTPAAAGSDPHSDAYEPRGRGRIAIHVPAITRRRSILGSVNTSRRTGWEDLFSAYRTPTAWARS
ncbi:hypothetical protein GCM10020220_077780 [Nonomuraea rubra]